VKDGEFLVCVTPLMKGFAKGERVVKPQTFVVPIISWLNPNFPLG